MSVRLLLVICFFTTCTFPSSLQLQQRKEVHVSSTTGNDSVCLTTASHDGGITERENIPCRTLEYVSLKLGQGESCSNLTIVIDSPLVVTSIVKFEGCNNLKIIRACGVEPCVLSCNIDACNNNEDVMSHEMCYEGLRLDNEIPKGFVFSNVRNLNISGLKVSECGHQNSRRHQNKADSKQAMAAVNLTKCTNVSLMDITIERSFGTALAMLNNYNKVTVTNANFSRNQNHLKCLSKDGYSFVGGVQIIYSSSPDVPTQFTFSNCTFSKNCAPKYHDSFKPQQGIVPKLSDYNDYGLGGGMNILFKNSTSHINITLSQCVFINNSAPWGAGVYIHFQDNATNNSVLVQDSLFHENNAFLAGGGADVGFDEVNSANGGHNMVQFLNTNFTHNQARYGGGVAIFALYSKFETGKAVYFDNCKWSLNTALYSAAVDISPFRFEQLSTGFLPVPAFSDCVFESNYLKKYTSHDTQTRYVTSGVFVVTRFTISFAEATTFYNNSQTALLTNSGRCIFNSGSQVNFNSNKGVNGAAIAMYGFSVLLLNTNSHFCFDDNSATGLGGGIYYHSNEERDFIEGRNCFLEYSGPSENKNITFDFANNSANFGGVSIFSVSFKPCFFRYLDNLDNHNFTDFFNEIGDFTFDQDSNTNTLSTVGMHFDICNHHNLDAIPGKPLTVPLVLRDEFNSTVKTEFAISIHKNHNVSVGDNFTAYNSMTLYGPPHQNTRVKFGTPNSIRQVYTVFNVTLHECPPGYFLDKNTSSCNCSADIDSQALPGIPRCNYSDFQAYFRYGDWIGFYSQSHTQSGNKSKELYVASCPLQFCRPQLNNSHYYLLPNSTKNLNKFICGKTRYGNLCGRCAHGFSAYYHSRHYSCKNSTNCHPAKSLFFYILSEIIPVVILFTVVITFNVSFTSGYANSFILFCQLLDLLIIDYSWSKQQDIFEKTLKMFQYIYLVIYGCFDLDFFNIEPLSFCMWRGAQVMDTLSFKYVTTIFALVLVFSLVSLMQCKLCSRLCKLKRKISTKASIIHGLSAFLVLAHAQCTGVTFNILRKSTLESKLGEPTYSVSYYGGLEYFGPDHLPYSILAVLFLIALVSLPPLLLFFHPLLLHILALCGLSEHRMVVGVTKVLCLNKLMPMFDSFQACFKDKMRFFAGLYFIVRIAILAIYANNDNQVLFYGLSEFILVVTLGLHAIAQPYKQRSHNIISNLLLLNMAIINGFTIFVKAIEKDDYYNNKPGKELRHLVTIGAVQMFLVYLPLLCALGYLFNKCAKRLRRKREQEREDFDVLIAANDRLHDYGAMHQN